MPSICRLKTYSASYTCNWFGVRDVANAVKYPGHAAFVAHALEPYNVNGVEKGSFKTQDNLSFLRAYGAGHMVMYYRRFAAPYFTRLD